MSTNFNEALQTAMSANLSEEGELTEAAQVIKRNVATPRDVYVVVNRNAPATPEEFAQGLADILEVILNNDSTTGIARS